MTTIGQMAKQLKVTTRTIRYYEEMGLMGKPGRVSGSMRTYADEDVVRLKFILKLKELGLTLSEMKMLAENYEMHNRVPEKMYQSLLEILEQHLDGIDKKMKSLDSLRKEIVAYRGRVSNIMAPETA